MTRTLFAATASLALLSACDMQGGDPQAANKTDNLAAQNVPANAPSPLGAAVSREQAKQVMYERHEGMEDIGDAMKLVSVQLKGDNPDLAAVREGAATIARLSPEVKGWYPPGTGPDVGKTRAKPAIWEKPDDFASKARAFEPVAQRFNAAAQGGDVAAIKAAHAELGKSCKACHDPYRAEEKEND